MGVPRKIPPNYGRSVPYRVGPSTQLARVESPDGPRDFTIYLYPWIGTDTGGAAVNVNTTYTVTHASGGIANVRAVDVSAVGRVLHVVASVVQVDTPGSALGATADARVQARIGMGRPSRWRQFAILPASLGTPSPWLQLPDFTEEVRVVSAFKIAGPGGADNTPATDAAIWVNTTNGSSTHGGYLVSDIIAQGGLVPFQLTPLSRFIRAQPPSGAGAGWASTVCLELQGSM